MNNKDLPLKSRIESALMNDERTNEYDFDIIDNNGVVTLKGKVHSPDVSKAAEQLATEQKGTVKVINQIQIMEEGDDLISGQPRVIPPREPSG